MKSYRMVALIMLAVMALSACTGQAPSPSTTDSTAMEQQDNNTMDTSIIEDDSMEQASSLHGEMVTYYTTDMPVEGYLSMPENITEDTPGIVLIHEWWGLNDNMKGLADKFADEGYIALAVDLYEGESTETPDQARVLATAVREDIPSAMTNLSAAIDYLKENTEANESKLASIGWCFGGGWAYELAKNNIDIAASVMYYGQFNEEDDLEHMKATLQGHFGEDDQGIPVDDVKAFQAKLAGLNGDHQVFIYENAGHAFANEDSDNYRQESAELAWDRTMEFLSEAL